MASIFIFLLLPYIPTMNVALGSTLEQEIIVMHFIYVLVAKLLQTIIFQIKTYPMPDTIVIISII